MGQGQDFFGKRMLSTVPTPYKAHWFFPVLSEELWNISFQRPPHGHDTWTKVRSVQSQAEARRATRSLSSSLSVPSLHCVTYSCARHPISIAWWLWPLGLPLRPLMREWKTELSLPMSALHRQKDCSSGNTGQEVREGSWPFVLNTTLLQRPACQQRIGQ